jgi:hypothetical protein
MIKIILVLMGLAALANAQIQSTAEVLGKGKSALFASFNAYTAKDSDTATTTILQYWHGVTDRVDVFAGTNFTSISGEKQIGANAGANINLVKTRAVSVSAFNMLSVPLNRRSDASAATWFAAAIASHDFHVVAVYGGYSATIPVGHISGRLFTSADVIHNFPVGIAIPRGKWAAYVEYNFGRKTQLGGLGIAYTF